jgi:hypothetical protein
MAATPAPLVARILILDIVLFPIGLFLGMTVFLAWKLLEHPYLYPLFVVATVVNLLVGVVQTRIVLDSLKDWDGTGER